MRMLSTEIPQHFSNMGCLTVWPLGAKIWIAQTKEDCPCTAVVRSIVKGRIILCAPIQDSFGPDCLRVLDVFISACGHYMEAAVAFVSDHNHIDLRVSCYGLSNNIEFSFPVDCSRANWATSSGRLFPNHHYHTSKR
jgi:hypothetical protein